MSPTDNSWHRAWLALGLQAPHGLQAALLQAYSEPQRHYHSLQHLQECLAHFDTALTLAQHPGEVELALWFHDAVYDPRQHDNEQRSADWAVAALQQASAPAEVQARMRRLVLATRHDTLPTEPDHCLVVDIDLTILGAPPERFAEYDRQVRAEYAWVPAPLYASKRREVLQGFLARTPIFQTEHFRQLLEAQARMNLEKMLMNTDQ